MTRSLQPQRAFGRFDSRELKIVSYITIAFTCLLIAVVVPAQSSVEMIDHTLFTDTVERMRSGTDYYEAMDASHLELYGPGRAAVTETVTGVRLPTTFLVWQLLPDDRAVWWLYIALAGVTGMVASQIALFPPLGVVVTGYILANGMLRLGDDWFAQFTATEFWSLSPLMIAAAAMLRRRWWFAAGFALIAFLVRELAAPILVVGALEALRGRAPRAPWLSALAVAIGAYTLHYFLASAYIDPDAATPLVGRAHTGSVARMMGFGLPFELVLGPVLWLLAMARIRQMDTNRLLVASFLLLPLTGLIVERRYWGVLVVPFTLVWGVDFLIHSYRSRTGSDSMAEGT